MTQGVITLLYKGKGARSSLDNYRPITLLNSDYKLFFFFFFLGGRDIHYINATITTSKKCDVHCKP